VETSLEEHRSSKFKDTSNSHSPWILEDQVKKVAKVGAAVDIVGGLLQYIQISRIEEL
jgi:hypothetical protein